MIHAAPLRFLFHEALAFDATSYGERKTKATLHRRDGETILFFPTDTRKTAKKGQSIDTFDAHFGLTADMPRSDLLLFYAIERAGTFTHRLAFIELKASEVEHGVDQIDCMVRVVRDKLLPILGSGFFHPHNLRAIVVSTRPTPNPHFIRKQTSFYKHWKFEPRLCRSDDEEALRACLK